MQFFENFTQEDNPLEEEKKKKQSSYNEEEIVKEFEKIEQSVPEIEAPKDDSLQLEKLEEPTFVQEDVEKQIEDLLAATYAQKQQNTENEKQQGLTSLEESKKKAEELYAADVEKAEQTYNAYRNRAETDALKRGLARSSIVLHQLDGIEQQKAQSLVQIQNNLTQTLQGLDADMQQLETEYTQAMQQLNLEKAQEKAQMLDEKYQEYLTTKQEVIEFNNKVEQAQKEWEAQKQEAAYNQALKNEEFKQEYGYELPYQTPQEEYEAKVNERNQTIQDKKYAYVKPIFEAMEKDEAIEILKNSTVLKEQLGIHYHDLMYTLQRRLS